eukprot:6183547-Pleurochrysis_carterae.AAC.3
MVSEPKQKLTRREVSAFDDSNLREAIISIGPLRRTARRGNAPTYAGLRACDHAQGVLLTFNRCTQAHMHGFLNNAIAAARAWMGVPKAERI